MRGWRCVLIVACLFGGASAFLTGVSESGAANSWARLEGDPSQRVGTTTSTLCHSLSDCLNSARQSGLTQHLQVPSAPTLPFASGVFQKSSRHWILRLEYRDTASDTIVEMDVSPFTGTLPCTGSLAKQTKAKDGQSACYVAGKGLRLLRQNLLYQIYLPAPRQRRSNHLALEMRVLNALKTQQAALSTSHSTQP
jgi:hypothetical protein